MRMINSGINKPRRAASTVPRSLHIVGGGDRRDAAVPAANVFGNLSGVLTTRLRETAAQCPAAARQALAVFYIDLNGFKSVNDAHGHHTGDQLLQIVAARLKNSMRAEDMVCRLGGDEFGCLLSGLPKRRQVSQVAAPPSIGIALAPGDGATSEDLLCRADAARYHAKQYRAGHAFFREAFPKGMTPDAPCVGTHC
jgi:GGDEF domain-containing protein